MENRGCDAEQTQALPAAALHQVSLLRARSSRSPSARVPTEATRVHHPATPRPRRPARPRTLLFTSMVPRQPLLTPCRWPRFMLSAGPAAASTGAGPRERGQRGRGARARESERRTAPRHRTCRGSRRAVPAAPRRPEGRTGSAAGGDAGPSQGDSGAAAAAVTRGRSTVPQTPQPRSLAASPAGTRAARRSCTQARLQPRRHVSALTCSLGAASAARAPPTPNRKRAPAPAAPANRRAACAARAARGRASRTDSPAHCLAIGPALRGRGGIT